MTRPPGLRAAANLIRLNRHKMLAHEDLKNAQVLIFANKQDVKEALTSAEISKSLNLTKLKGISWHIQVAVLSLNWTLKLLVNRTVALGCRPPSHLTPPRARLWPLPTLRHPIGMLCPDRRGIVRRDGVGYSTTRQKVNID